MRWTARFVRERCYNGALSGSMTRIRISTRQAHPITAFHNYSPCIHYQQVRVTEEWNNYALCTAYQWHNNVTRWICTHQQILICSLIIKRSQPLRSCLCAILPAMSSSHNETPLSIVDMSYRLTFTTLLTISSNVSYSLFQLGSFSTDCTFKYAIQDGSNI